MAADLRSVNFVKGTLVIRSVSFIIAVAASFGTAYAAQTYSATLDKPVAAKIEVLAESNLFRCEGSTCTLVSAPIDAGSPTTCRRLAREVGPLKSYGTEKSQFSAEDLARCNAK